MSTTQTKQNSTEDKLMKQKKLREFIVENKEEIEKVLELDTLKNEMEKLKKDMEMLGFLKKLFQNDESKLTELKTKNKQLKEELASVRETVLTLQQEQQQQHIQNKKLQTDYTTLTHQNKTLQEELFKAQETPLNKLQALYETLSPTTQTGLKNSLHSNDPLTLFASGILHVEPLWDYAKHLLLEEKEDFATLREIFYLLFEPYKEIEELTYQQVSVGEEFDTHEHIRDSKSEPAGTIKTIQLKGFCRDGEVIKKTVVSVL